MSLNWRGPFLRTAVLCSGLGLLSAVTITWRMPKLYESNAVLEEPEPAGELRIMVDQDCLAAKLGARRVFIRALERLGWPRREGTELEGSLAKLGAMTRIDGANLATLRVRHADPAAARDIAWAIVEAFGELRGEGLRSELGKNVRELSAQVAVQQQKVDVARAKLEEVARKVTPEQVAADPAAFAPPKPPMTEEELLTAGRELAARDPRLNPVVLRETPEVPVAPVAPVWWLNLTIGALAGLGLTPPAAWLLGRRQASSAA